MRLALLKDMIAINVKIRRGGKASILNKRRVISSPYTQRAERRSVREKLKEKMGHKLMFGSHFSYKYGQLYRSIGGNLRALHGFMGYA